MKVFVAILAWLFVTFAVASFEGICNVNDDPTKKKRQALVCAGIQKWMVAVGLGLIVGLAYFFSRFGFSVGVVWPSIPCYLALLAVTLYVLLRGNYKASAPSECLAFVVLLGIIYLVWLGSRSPVYFAYSVGNAFIASVIKTVPHIVTLVGLFVVLGFVFLHHREKATEDEQADNDNAKYYFGAAVACFVVAGIIAGLFLGLGFRWSALSLDDDINPESSTVVETAKEDSTPEPRETAQETVSSGIKWHHDDVLLDNEGKIGQEFKEAKLNDYDFGTSAVLRIVLDKVSRSELKSESVSGKGEKELLPLVTREEVLDEFLAGCREDPAKLAACVAWYDANMHTNLLGDFYVNVVGQEEAWMRAINAAAQAWEKDPEAFRAAYDSFERAIKHVHDYTVEYVESGLTDQMYMYGFTVGERPTVIVMQTAQENGVLLTFTEIVKGNAVTFSYRATCDFQPVNVAEKLEVEPQDNPTGSDIKRKDPTKGTKVGKNDTDGPGSSTNNGVGATTSTADTPSNSDHGSEEDYWNEIEELGSANDDTRGPGDSNDPTTPPGDSAVDNGADDNPYGDPNTGSTGVGGSTYGEDEPPITEEPPGGEWDGP